MAIAIVQSKVVTTGTFAASRSLSFDSTPAVGNLVLVCISWYFGSFTWSITDNQGGANTYSLLQASAASIGVRVHAAPVVAASGTFTVTATPSGSAYISIVLVELSGVDLVTPKDVSGTAAYSGGAGDIPVDIPDTTIANDQVFGVATGSSGGTAFVPASGWTLVKSYDVGNSVDQGISVITAAAGAPGAYDPTWTFSSGSGMHMVGVAIAPGASAGSTARAFATFVG